MWVYLFNLYVNASAGCANTMTVQSCWKSHLSPLFKQFISVSQNRICSGVKKRRIIARVPGERCSPLIVTSTIRAHHCHFVPSSLAAAVNVPEAWWYSPCASPYMLCGHLWPGTANLAWSATIERWQNRERGTGDFHTRLRISFKLMEKVSHLLSKADRSKR